jgi:hypothetical protein
MTSAGTRSSRKVRWRRTDSSASSATSGSTTRKLTLLGEEAAPAAPESNRTICASGAAATRRRPASAIRVSLTARTSSIVTLPQTIRIVLLVAHDRIKATMRGRSATQVAIATKPHLATLVADGTVRPSEGPRYLPQPAAWGRNLRQLCDWIATRTANERRGRSPGYFSSPSSSQCRGIEVSSTGTSSGPPAPLTPQPVSGGVSSVGPSGVFGSSVTNTDSSD